MANRWVIFHNNEIRFWTEDEQFANFTDVPFPDEECDILMNIPNFDGTQGVRLIVDESGNKIPELYDYPLPTPEMIREN